MGQRTTASLVWPSSFSHRSPDLDALACNVEVILFDLRPFRDVGWMLEGNTQVWIVETEHPLPYGWAWRC